MASISTPFDASKLPDPNLQLPDLGDAVMGWRAWRTDVNLPRYGAAPKLFSVTHGDYYWTPQRAALAECRRCKGEGIPGEKCACGFYSAKSLEHLMSMGYHYYDADTGNVTVVGKVANWGKVIEGSQGWRAAKAYPVQLFVPFEAARLAKPLREAYDCKVSLMNVLGKSALLDEAD